MSGAASLRSALGSIAALVAGGLVFALEIWTVLPAPNLYTLALAASIPELTAWAVPCCVAAGVIAQGVGRGWARTTGVFCAALALGFALVPWCLLPATISASDAEMRAALGAGLASNVAPRATTALLARPYDTHIALTGYGRAAEAVRVDLDLPVRVRDGARLALDLYRPAGRGPHPAIILIYGGAWIFGSRASCAELGSSFAQLGYTAIAIDYRHAPAYVYPTQLDDVDDMLATIARNAAAWNVDPRRVALFGRSAGAQLALLAAYDPQSPLTVRAAVGYYSPIDLVHGYFIPPVPDPLDVPRILRAYLGGTPEARAGAYLSGSPLQHVRRGLPPTLLICGGRDEVVLPRFQAEMRDALRRSGNRVAALQFPWSNHAFDTIGNGTGGQLARYYTQRFLAATL